MYVHPQLVAQNSRDGFLCVSFTTSMGCSQLPLSVNSGRFDLCRAACAAIRDAGASSNLPMLVCLGMSQSCAAPFAKGLRGVGLLLTFRVLHWLVGFQD